MPRTYYTFLAALLLLAASAHAATDSWTGGTGNWADAPNWTNDSNQHVIPATGDNVQIVNSDGVSRTITNVYDYTIPVTTLSGLTVDLTGGTGSATNTLDNSASTLIVTGNEVIGNLGSGTLIQTSNPHTVGGSISIGAQAGSTGAFNVYGLTTAGSVYVGGSSAGAGGAGTLAVNGELDVNGTLTAYNTPGSGITLSNVSNNNTISASALNFNGNPSLFNWQNGRLILNSDVNLYAGAPATSTSAAFGSSLSLNSSKTLIVNGNETIGGLGTFSLDTGYSHTVNGTLTVAQGGTLTASPSLYAPTIIQSGGTINGTLVNRGNYTYQNGSFYAGLVNQGTVDLGGNFSAYGIENDANMTIADGQTITTSGGYPASFDNFGNLTLAGGILAGNGTLINEAAGTMNAHGTVQLNVTNNGRMVLDGVLDLINSGIFTNSGILQGNGEVRTYTYFGSGENFSNTASGIINVAPGKSIGISSDWTNSGLVNIQGGDAILGGGKISNHGTIQGAGYIASRIENSSVIRAQGGELDLAGYNSTNNYYSSIQVTAGSTIMFLQGLQYNYGAISLTSGTFDNNNHQLYDDSNAIINGSGTFRTGGLYNYGKLNVGAGNMDVFGWVVNNGTIGIQTGQSINFYGDVSGSGSFTGTGTAVFLGALSPGNSPAAVSFAGNADLTSISALKIELGGTTAGSQYDKLNVAGQLALGGTLDVELIDGFHPQAGQSFHILNWGSLSGSFANLDLPLNGHIVWDTSHLYDAGALSVVATYYAGDFNRDGHVDASDINAAMKALTDLSGYESQYSVSAANLPLIDDVNGDGSFTNADLQSLLDKLKSGAGSENAVPEPSTFALFSLGTLLGAIFKRPRAFR